MIAYIAPKLKPQSVPKGEEIYFVGHPADDIFFIKSGRVSLYTTVTKYNNKMGDKKDHKREEEYEVGRVHEGHLFGETDILFNANVRKYTARCTEASELLMLHKMEFKECVSLFRNENEELQKNAKLRASYWEKQEKIFIERAKKKAQQDKFLRVIDEASKPINLDDQKLEGKQRRLMEKNEKVDYVIRQIDDKTAMMKNMEEKLSNLSNKLFRFMQSTEGVEMSKLIKENVQRKCVSKQFTKPEHSFGNNQNNEVSNNSEESIKEEKSEESIQIVEKKNLDKNNLKMSQKNEKNTKKNLGKKHDNEASNPKLKSLEVEKRQSQLNSLVNSVDLNANPIRKTIYPKLKCMSQILANQIDEQAPSNLMQLSFGKKALTHSSDEEKGFIKGKSTNIIKSQEFGRPIRNSDNLNDKKFSTKYHKHNRAQPNEHDISKFDSMHDSPTVHFKDQAKLN